MLPNLHKPQTSQKLIIPILRRRLHILATLEPRLVNTCLAFHEGLTFTTGKKLNVKN